MSKGDYLGEFEHLLMLAILRLEDNAYGMALRRELEARTGREVSIGAVYATLERLEAKGLVQSHDEEPPAEQGGRAKRVYAVSEQGGEALGHTHQALGNMMEGLALPGKKWKAGNV